MTRERGLRVPAPRLEPDDLVLDRLASLAAASGPAGRTRRSAVRVALASLGATAVVGAGAVTAGALTGHLDPFAPTGPRSPAPGPVERSVAPDPPEPPASDTDPSGPRTPAAASDATSNDAASGTDPGRNDRAPGQQFRPPGRQSDPGRRRSHDAEHPAHGEHMRAGPDAGSGWDERESPGRGHGIRPDRPRGPAGPDRADQTPPHDARGTGWPTTR